MPPGGIKSDGTGHIALDDVEHAPSGKVALMSVFTTAHKYSKYEAPLSQAETTCGNAAPGIAKLASPRLNIAIHVVGSRGDVQPFIPIAQMLSRPPFNHRVRICTHPVFKGFIEGHGIEFFSIGGDPEALMAYMVKNPIFDAVKLANVRAVVSQGWGTLGGEDVGVPENLYLIGNCPHDWLFQRVSVVVHHGGAGTTAAGIAAGRPTVVVPFFGDQPFWGQMIARAGAGPTPIPFKKMTAESLAASILFALNPEVKEAAQRLAQTIMQEDGASNAAMDFLNRLDVDELRCDLCPDRLAIWKHKSTGTRLSGFAMTCLVDKKLVQPNDSKLLQHRHWYVNEGAEHPIIGAVAAASGLFTALGTAASDYHGRLKGRHRPVASSSETLHQPSSSATIVDEGAEFPTSSRDNTKDHDGILKGFLYSNPLTPMEMETIAYKIATKSLRTAEPDVAKTQRAPTAYDKQKAAWRAQEQGINGHAYYIARATGRFAVDVTKASLKAPVAFFYNVANGFHNYPSYSFGATEVRRRGEITGLGSGLRVAGEEFVLGFWDAFSGVVMKPYESTKDEGARGFSKGVLRGARGFAYNLGACEFPIVIWPPQGRQTACTTQC
ncbi:hypothetical protein HZS61_001841 [Fusarium oxysporum f. sp. conglutinans]|uniref:Glycosyltransferase family 28 N-terminal domain-containing protein n=1 Tax=Fusarium oxysporum f. sp. conglutinans TaxID=100902 RepID=A0A8H6H6A4_FUSOX|nr:hypothetical protein HZS61_001841 [Fusarium oxysporum f. sp. conglutinans]